MLHIGSGGVCKAVCVLTDLLTVEKAGGQGVGQETNPFHHHHLTWSRRVGLASSCPDFNIEPCRVGDRSACKKTRNPVLFGQFS